MNLFESIPELLRRKEDFVLATILDRSGSAPRAVGARMIIRSDSSIIGTVGGGVLEAKVQHSAKHMFTEKGTRIHNFVLTAEDAVSMGMMCGGQLQVMAQFVDSSDPSNMELYEALLSMQKIRRGSWLVTRVPRNETSTESPLQGIVLSDGSTIGLQYSKEIVNLTLKTGASRPELVRNHDDRFLVEPLCGEGTVYIFGAGHISQKLAPLTKLVGFHTVVLDDRKEFANRQLFESADEVIVLESFEDALGGLELDEKCSLVLVTRGHAHDKTVLRLALGSNAGYIGMIGSRKKRDAIYRDLAEEGIETSHFERVHSPIGLNIGAETPEEIAVSIVAELIEERAKKYR